MYAYEAYYSNGRFVPIGDSGIGKLAEGTRAIITVLNKDFQKKTEKTIEERLREFDKIVKMIEDATDEEIPEIERIKFRELEI